MTPVKEEVKEIFKRFRKEKRPEVEEIPEGSIRCTRCGRIVRKENAVISLPEEWWVCDQCYFGGAKLIAQTGYFKAYKMGTSPKTLSNRCMICRKPLKGIWCTREICQKCCEEGLCSSKDLCKAYPLIKTNREKKVIENPSRRVIL